jgi:hypothetical protein
LHSSGRSLLLLLGKAGATPALSSSMRGGTPGARRGNGQRAAAFAGGAD